MRIRYSGARLYSHPLPVSYTVHTVFLYSGLSLLTNPFLPFPFLFFRHGGWLVPSFLISYSGGERNARGKDAGSDGGGHVLCQRTMKVGVTLCDAQFAVSCDIARRVGELLVVMQAVPELVLCPPARPPACHQRNRLAAEGRPEQSSAVQPRHGHPFPAAQAICLLRVFICSIVSVRCRYNWLH